MRTSSIAQRLNPRQKAVAFVAITKVGYAEYTECTPDGRNTVDVNSLYKRKLKNDNTLRNAMALDHWKYLGTMRVRWNVGGWP